MDLLIYLAWNGIADSATVEGWASQWGLAPLASRPPADAFDPNALPAWNLAMTVTWIVSRDMGGVLEAQDSYRAECLEWDVFAYGVPAPGGKDFYDARGEELKPKPALTLATLQMLEAIGEPFFENARSTIRDARTALWNACGENRLAASAIDASGAVVSIPAHEWSRLAPSVSGDGPDRLVWTHDTLTTAYRLPSFPRTDVLKLWPADAGAPQDGEAASKPHRKRKLAETCNSLRALYPRGVPRGLLRKTLLEKVNRHLDLGENSTVEMSTLNRALRMVREDSTPK